MIQKLLANNSGIRKRERGGRSGGGGEGGWGREGETEREGTSLLFYMGWDLFPKWFSHPFSTTLTAQ